VLRPSSWTAIILLKNRGLFLIQDVGSSNLITFVGVLVIIYTILSQALDIGKNIIGKIPNPIDMLLSILSLVAKEIKIYCGYKKGGLYNRLFYRFEY
jgi:hypothetical protein